MMSCLAKVFSGLQSCDASAIRNRELCSLLLPGHAALACTRIVV